MNVFKNVFQKESVTLQSILTLTFMREGRKKISPSWISLEHGETEGWETEEWFGNHSLST